MSKKFDAYYEWLGIKPKDQPPHHYRLLGIDPLEEDPNVIENSADRQMAHVRSFQASKHSDASQKLLNEISAAKICLLNKAEKAAYDKELRKKLGGASPPVAAKAKPMPAATLPAATPPAVPLSEPAIGLDIKRPTTPLKRGAASPARGGPAGARAKKGDSTSTMMIGAGILGVIILVGGAIFALTSQPSARPTAPGPVAKVDPEPLKSNSKVNPPSTIGPFKGNESPGGDTPQIEIPKFDPPTSNPPHDPPPAADETPLEAANPDRLLAYFPLDEGEGIHVRDRSGSKHDGVIKGAAKWIEGRQFGGLAFDGSQHVEFGDVCNFGSRSPLTVGAWLRIGQWHNCSIVARLDGGDEGYHGWELCATTDGWVYFHFAHNYSLGDGITLHTDKTLPRDQWVHVAATYDGSQQAKGVTIYIDGEPQTVQVGQNNLRGDVRNNQPLRLGSRGQGHERLQGQLDDVRIYGRALTADEMKRVVAQKHEKANPDFASPTVALRTSDEPKSTRPGGDTSATGEPGGERLPIPDEAAIAAAAKTVKELFSDEIAKAKTPEDRGGLADKLVDQARGSLNEPAAAYALLNEARALAVAAGHVDAARQVVDTLSETFDVDRWKLSETVFSELAPKVKAAGKAEFATAAMAAAEAASEAEQFNVAVKLTALANAAAGAAGEAELRKEIIQRKTSLEVARKQFDAYQAAQEALAANPDDAAAQLIVGRFLSFVRDRWDEGLAMLAKGGDNPLAELARRDIAATNETPVALRLELGDAWSEQADKLRSEAQSQSACYARAVFWYGRAALDARGLDKAKADQRLKDLADKVKPGSGGRADISSAAWLQGPPGLLRTYEGHTALVRAVAVNAKHRLLASGGDDRTVRVFDLATGKEQKQINIDRSVICVALSADGRYVIAGRQQRDATIWDLKSGAVTKFESSPFVNVVAVAFFRKGSLAATSAYDELAVIDVPSLKPTFRIPKPCGDGASVKAMALSARNDVIACGANMGLVFLYNARTGAEVHRLSHDGNSELTALEFSPDGSRLVVGDRDGNLALWDVAKRQAVASLRRPPRISAAAFSPDGKRLLLAGDANRLDIVDAGTGADIEHVEIDAVRLITSLQVLGNAHVVLGASDGKACLWRLPDATK